MNNYTKDRWLATSIACLLLCGAFALFTLGYLPEKRKADASQRELEEARSRIENIRLEKIRVYQRIQELEVGVPAAVDEAIREVLKKGKSTDYIATGK